MYSLNGRAVTDIYVEGIDTKDYPDFVDAYIAEAVWEDTREALNSHQLDQLNDQAYGDGYLLELVQSEVF